MSPFLPLDLGKLCTTLNMRDGLDLDLWGGGDTIIGSPRKAGSGLKPDELTDLLNKEMTR